MLDWQSFPHPPSIILNVLRMQAAAAMAVGVGSFSDPDDVPVSRQHNALISVVININGACADCGAQAISVMYLAMILMSPGDTQGMSHYLEHMLFMGSEKFPDENDYDSYLQHNGGAANAYTEMVLYSSEASLSAMSLCRSLA